MTAKPICNTLTRCLMIPAITLMLFAACSDSLADPRQNPTSAFSFRLSAAQLSSSSRALSYDLMETSVDEGTLIGCVIAYANTDGSLQYVANSAWEYHTEGLLRKKLFNEANDPIDIDSWENTIILPASHPDAVNTAVEPSPYDLTLKEGHNYAFYFYYPYFDEEAISKEFSAILPGNINLKTLNYPNPGEDKDGEAYQYTYYPNGDTNPIKPFNEKIAIWHIGNADTDATDHSKAKRAAWTQYKVTPMIDFRANTEADGIARLNHSDFMYAAVTTDNNGNPINTTNSHSPIPVVMKKQMATIDLCFAEKPTDLYISPNLKDNKPLMPRLKEFDLSTGSFTKTNYINIFDRWNGSLIQQCAAYASPIYPQYIGTSRELSTDGLVDYHIYRVILMPQAAGELNCDIKFTVGEKQFTLQNLQNNPLLSSLKGGTYYKIRFSKLEGDSGWHLVIDDWEKGDDITLDRP